MAIKSAARRSPGRAPRAKKPGTRQSGLVSGAAGGGEAGSGARIPANASFLGRAGEVSEVSRLLEGERLVTLTGAPGIGKTRLAVELAGELGESFAGGPHVVELAPVAGGAAVAGAVASALSVAEQPGQKLIETIAARLGERRLLLVLDNCEHLISGCAELVETLLARCPELRVLATSRERLGLAAERVWEVPPLPVPEPEEESVPEGLLSYPAVALFVEHAAAVQPGFSLTAYVAPAVAGIARRLDGIPLAIELAAARVESLTPEEIARRLDDRFDLLSDGAVRDVSRHQTLRAALDWSYELLTAPERALLRRLSVFVGGFEVEAVEAVCTGGEVPAGQVRELLAALVAKSLVVNASESAARWRLLETIRAYAAERLEQSGETAGLRGAHARCYLALAEQAEPELTGPAQQNWLERLEAERENLRGAIEWSLSHGETEQALRLAGALVLFWRVRCHFSEGRELLEAALSASSGKAPALRAKAQWGAGLLAFWSGADGGIRLLEESRLGFKELRDRQGHARTLCGLGICTQYSDGPRSLALLEQSVAVAREVGDRWCLSTALCVAGFVHSRRGQLQTARTLLAESLQVAREAQDKQGLRFPLTGLGSVALSQGDFDLAHSLLEEAVAVSTELGDYHCQVTAMTFLGHLAIGRGDPRRARRLVGEIQALLQEAGMALPAFTAAVAAHVRRLEGDREGAGALFEDIVARSAPDEMVLFPALQGLGQLARDNGKPTVARELAEQALGLARAHGYSGAVAYALRDLGHIARTQGRTKRSLVLHREALEIWRRMGNAPQMVATVEAVAGIAAQEARYEEAGRLIGAADGYRRTHGYACDSWEGCGHVADPAVMAQGAGKRQFEAALAEGAALSLEEAVDLALPGQTQQGRHIGGWLSLTTSERKVAALVARGLSNPEIAEQCFITPRTVKFHLTNTFRKLGVTGRAELAQEVGRRGGGRLAS